MIKIINTNRRAFKTVSLFLLLGMFAALISCNTAGNAPAGDDANNPAANPAATEPVTSIDDVYPYPEHDFKSAVINVLARNDGYGGQDFEDISVGEENGEVLNDAVYRRTLTVEDKYNVKISVVYNKDPVGITAKNVKADDDAYQIVQEKLIYLQQTLSTQNYLMDFNKIDGVTLEAPWYNQNIIKDLSLNKKVTALGGDMTISDKSGVEVTMFNKQMVADYALDDMYQLVRDGKWTLDKFHELMKATSKDLNGDGKMTLGEDQWGLMAEHLISWVLLVSSGNRLADLDADGIPYITANTPKFLSDFDKIMDIMYDKENRTMHPTSVEAFTEIFMDNRNFLQINVMTTLFMMRGMENDFGIIPPPKQNAQQEKYISTMSPWVSRFIAVPVSCQNTGTVGAVIDALSRESTNTVMPAYYNNLINNKIARDEESIEMLKMIFDSVVYDIGSIYNWGNIWLMYQGFFESGSRDYVSFFEKNSGAIQKALDATIEQMLQYD